MYMRYYLDEKGNRVYTLKVFYFMSYLFNLYWGLGIGDWGLGPIPNPQSPIPNNLV